MTTYRLDGTAVYFGYYSGDFIRAEDPGIKLEFVMPDAVTTFSYTLNTPFPGDPIGSAVLDTQDYNIRFNGRTLVDSPYSNGFAPDLAAFLNVHWSGGTTTFMGFVFTGFNHPTLGRLDAEYYFDVGGAPGPVLTSEASYDAFNDSMTGASAAAGGFSPGLPIAFSALRGVTISESDRIQGTSEDDTYDGGKGRDRIDGKDGADHLMGGRGNDILIGGWMSDVIDGGGGIDTASYFDARAGSGGRGVTVDILYDDRNDGLSASGDVLISIENLTGSRHDDSLFGSGRDNVLNGWTGDDRIEGRGGNDRILGGTGNDLLFGQAGNDRIDGGGGRDLIAGGLGNDTLTGGAARDTFVFNAGADVITDFDGDILRLDDGLWGNAPLTPAEILDFAEVVNGDTLFDFGGGHTLTLRDFTDIAGLEARIEVF